MIIPYEQLNHETLISLIEEFITREGTDYGLEELSLELKVAGVKRQLVSGEVLIVYDAGSETVNLMTSADYRQLMV